MPDGFHHVETQCPLEKKNILQLRQRSKLLDRMRGRRTMRPPSVLTAKIKTNAIWARIIRNCLLSPEPRVICRAVSACGLLPYLRPCFSSSNYTLLKRWKNLKSLLKHDRFSSFAPPSLRYAFYILSFFLLSRFISRVFDCVSWRVSRDIIPTGFLSLSVSFPSLFFFFFPFSLPISVSTEIARHLGKQGISNEGFSRYFFFCHSNCF